MDTIHADWMRRGLPILQAPVRMDFGYTFVASDPDGHRFRVFGKATLLRRVRPGDPVIYYSPTRSSISMRCRD